MAKQVRELSELSIKRLTYTTKPDGREVKAKHPVGGVSGLYLQCQPPKGASKNGTKQWILRAVVGGKRREIGLGSYPTVPTKKARERARELRDDIARGLDPVIENKAAKAQLKALQTKDITFEQYCKSVYIPDKAQEFKSAPQVRRLRNCAEASYPVIGNMRLEDIQRNHIVQIIKPLWTTHHEKANRVKNFLYAVIQRAIAEELRTKANPATWQGDLEHSFPASNKVHKVKHSRRIDWKEAPSFWKALWALDKPIGSRPDVYAFAVMMLTVGRKEEVAHGDWSEISLDKKIWLQPAGKYKSAHEWAIPLVPTVIRLLKMMEPKRKGRIFTSINGRVLGNQLTSLPDALGFDAVAHGFRGTFSRWAKDKRYPTDLKDLCMKHLESSSTRAAYEQDDAMSLFNERRKVLLAYEKWVTKGD